MSRTGNLARLRRALPATGAEFNSLALMAATAVTGVLGLVFWVATAWGHPAADVGRAAAVISSATMLAAFANLSLGQMYERFLATGGRRARRFIHAGYGLTSALAIALGTGFVLLGPAERLFPTTTEAALFPVYVAVIAVFALQDPILVGLHAARWAAVKNIAHSVLKLALVILFAILLSTGTSVVWAWMIPTAAVAVLVHLGLSGRWLHPFDRAAPALPPAAQLWHYFAASYAMTLAGGMAPFVIPLIVVARLDTGANAYFNGAWTLIAALALLFHVLPGPFIARAGAEPDRLPALAARLARMQALIGLGGALGLALAGPVFLRVMGPDYAAHATDLLRWVALSLPLLAVNAFYVALCCIRRRLRLAVAAQYLAAVVVVTGSLLLVAEHGITAIGWSYLAAEAAVVLVIAAPLARMVLRLRREHTATEAAATA